MSNPRLGWQKLQDVYYCLSNCYDNLQWDLKGLQHNHKVVMSPQASLFAVAAANVVHPSVIDLYSTTGSQMASVVYNSTASDYIIGFTFYNEDLVVVLSSGKYRYYSDLIGNFTEYDYRQEVIELSSNVSLNVNKDQFKITNLETDELENIIEVLQVEVYGKFLILRSRNSINLVDLETFQNYTITIDFTFFHCMSFLKVENEVLTILIASGETISLLTIDINNYSFTLEDQQLTDGPFVHISGSPNSELVSLYNANASKIFVINSNFDQVLLEYDTAVDKPYQVAWCGNDAIVVSLKDELRLIGPGQQSISFYYDDSDLQRVVPLLYTRVDGLTVVTDHKVEFLGRVPNCSIHLYQVGSSSPCSILLDCVDKLSQHSPKADTNISLLKSDDTLGEAMSECLEAAVQELSPFWQRKILRAVSFGKVYYKHYDATNYLSTVSTLHVLNQLRSSEIGIFLTYNQLISIGWEAIINMLLKRNLHFLAIKVLDTIGNEHLKENVYLHWCCAKIQKELDMSDIELFQLISEKLEDKLVPIANISEIALQEGRVNLCRLLINLEPNISQKISSFVKLGDLELALNSSFQSGDYDLCHLILLFLYNSLSIQQFMKVLNQNESKGVTIYDTSLKNTQDLAKRLRTRENLYISGDLITNFWIRILEHDEIKENANNFEEFHKQIKFIENYKDPQYYEIYRKQLTNVINSSSTNRKDIKDYQTELQLLETKKRLSETYHESFYDKKSILDVFTRLIEMNQDKPVLKLAKDFKVPIEKVWFLTLNVYTKNGEFDRLFNFVMGQNKSNTISPIGWKPIVERCLLFKAPQAHIASYINNCTNLHYSEKIQLYIKNNDLQLAASEAFKYKDNSFLDSILVEAQQQNQTTIVNQVKDYRQRLGL